MIARRITPAPTPRAALPNRDLPSARERMRHTRAAQAAGILTGEEAGFMRDCIHCGVDEFDVYQENGQWIVWTHDGPRGVAWWQALYAEACYRDRGKR